MFSPSDSHFDSIKLAIFSHHFRGSASSIKMSKHLKKSSPPKIQNKHSKRQRASLHRQGNAQQAPSPPLTSEGKSTESNDKLHGHCQCKRCSTGKRRHHCPYTKNGTHDLSPRCYEKGHVAWCEECGHRFSTMHGCENHSFRDGFNTSRIV